MTVTVDQKNQGTAQTTARSRSTVNNSHNAAMSLTYSDFLYTRNDYADGYDEDEAMMRSERRSLPSDFRPIQETKVPLLQNADVVNQDFILIAEFSELEGPIPLGTIPNDAPDKTDVVLNDFVVHLMSTDYQVNNAGQFRISQDTQVMRKNVFPDCHVFMQYFTLYDIKARGFVRPFCFGYVSKDYVKLDKHVNFLISEFGKVTSVLEYCNREWFLNELQLYLEKLDKAKESFLQEQTEVTSAKDGDSKDNQSQSDDYVDSETVTLAQIAHQYSEILSIFNTVKKYESPNQKEAKESMKDILSFFERYPDCSLANFLDQSHIYFGSKANISTGSSTSCSSESILNVPLVHPLRPKGEPLRPLTVLGQLGSVYLIGKLMQIYNCCKMDIIFAEMTETTIAFRQHFDNLRLQHSPQQQQHRNISSKVSPGKSSSGISSSAGDLDQTGSSSSNHNDSGSTAGISYCEEADEDTVSKFLTLSPLPPDTVTPFELLRDNNGKNPASLWANFRKKEVQQIIEKLHMYAPVIPDNKSGSYHTVSEEESDFNIPDGTVSTLESTIDTVSGGNGKGVNRKGSVETSVAVDDVGQSQGEGSSSNARLKMSSMNSFSSDEDISLASSAGQYGSSEETILKEPWWIYASGKLVPGVPGYGLGNFFRRYPCSHHVLFSVLLGRPIIICGEEKLSRKIGRIITALIPLVPGGASSSKSWKLLRWHRGILVQAHIEAYRLIGLCIPEKLEVHDLIPPRLVTLVTILSVDRKSILGGPAYSGDFLQGFEKKVQKHFHNSDVSLLSYIGQIYTEIEAKVYMYKSLMDQRKGKKTSASGTTTTLCKELGLRASDVEIVKHFAKLISHPSDCVNIL